MKKLMMAVIAFLSGVTMSVVADTEVIENTAWTYTVLAGEVHITGCNQTTGHVIIPETIKGMPVVSLGGWMFADRTGVTMFTIPEGVREFKERAFCNCHSSINIPSTVKIIGTDAIGGVTIRSWRVNGSVSIGQIYFGYTLQELIVYGQVPSMFANLPMCSYSGRYCCDRMYVGAAASLFNGKLGFGGYVDSMIDVTVLSSNVRENDSTIIDVVYKVTSERPNVKVRVLAFEDGQRSFAKVVRPETFVDGTEANIGDEISANVEHKISWKVSSDWSTKLAKVRIEVLVKDTELLPLATMTIPASEQYGKMKITWNVISDSQVFDALLWLYADKDPALTLSNGVLKNGATELARNDGLSNGTYTWDSGYFDDRVSAARYVLQKMGYSLLTGAPLTYANQETRLGLSPSGARQYGYKIVE